LLDAPFSTRTSGILLHPTSLPGPPAMGDIGPAARAFVDFLQAAKQTWWQMLPIHPIGAGNSPYDSSSAFAGSTLLVSLEGLVEDGLVAPRDVADLPRIGDPRRAEYDLARDLRPPLLRRAYEQFQNKTAPHLEHEYRRFLDENGSWLWDWCLFRALKVRFERRAWTEWPSELARRDQAALSTAHQTCADEVGFQAFLQFVFSRQWTLLRDYARGRGVRLMGDVPMFVAHDSVDVWANQHMFFLNEQGHRTVQAGVPPDYFSEDGQLWGNPLYRWDVMRSDGYGWWIDRLRRELLRFDAVRLDHFVAFHRYWEVAIGQDTAKNGRYVEVPGRDFLQRAREVLGGLPLLAEDLGIVTSEVNDLRDGAGLPGMRILQFAFNPGAETYLPHSHPPRSVVYTGTHDNNTTRGWFELLLAHAAHGTSGDERRRKMASDARVELDRIRTYTGISRAGEVSAGMLRALLTSPALTAIFPIQDALDEGAEARMNVPGIAEGNWAYRVAPDALSPDVAQRLADLVAVTQRAAR